MKSINADKFPKVSVLESIESVVSEDESVLESIESEVSEDESVLISMYLYCVSTSREYPFFCLPLFPKGRLSKGEKKIGRAGTAACGTP